MNKGKNKFYITTAIDYASGAPHIGHAYEKIAADVLARWNRKIGNEVFFQTGLDEHGQKIVETSLKINKEPQQFVDLISKQFLNLIKRLNISNDYFIRTTNNSHKEIVSQILQKSFDNGDIYKGKYEGYYCSGCERYFTEDEVDENKICPDHKSKLEFKSEENYFFKLSKYQDKLLKFYEENSDFISPKSKQKEILNRINEGLRDISISRNKDSLNWGIDLPFDNSHVTYVWFDALFNYYSGPKINGKEDFFPADVHVIGHDISWFHIVYWPAFLMSVNENLPKKVFLHGMILDGDGHKMSKSLGNVIDPLKFSKEFGLDEMRYFLLSAGSFSEDICFSKEIFAEKVNNELNNDFGNLVSRVHTMTEKYFNGIVPKIENLEEVDKQLIEKFEIFDEFNKNMQNLSFNLAIENLLLIIRETNAYINKVSPWKEENENRLKTIISILVSSIKVFGEYFEVFMPQKIERLRKQYDFNLENGIENFKFKFIKEGHSLKEKDNLFSKIKLEKKVEPKVEEVKREGFSLMNLKVGEIIDIKQHPEAEKLFIETIDLGEDKPRQIVSGLAKYYDKEYMLGKKVIVLTNLKPAKLRGVKSEGMILVSEDENEENTNLGLLLSNSKIGENLESENILADNPKRIKIDEFFKFDFKSDGEKVYFNKKEVLVSGKSIIIDRKIKGIIC